MVEYARVRRFLGMSQFNVAAAVGIPLSRLSSFERGHCKLNRAEEAVLRDFLKTRLSMALETDREAASSPRGRSVLGLLEKEGLG